MSTPSLEIQDYYPTHFGENWEHLVQQHVSRIRGYVSVDGNVRGERKSYNQIGKAQDREITTRNGATTATTRLDEKRWVSLKPYDTVHHFDEWDEQLLGDVILPTSETVQSQGKAFGRRCDKVIIEALEGAALTGELGTTSTAVPSSQEVAVNFGGSNEGLTLGKLIEAKSILGKNEAYGQNLENDEMLCIIVSQQQIDDLLNNVDQVRNADYAAVKALVEGEVNHFMGFHFIRSEELTLVSATDVRTCIAYVKSGCKFAVGTERSTKFAIRDDLNETLQIRSKWRIGATRMEEEKVVLVYADESP